MNLKPLSVAVMAAAAFAAHAAPAPTTNTPNSSGRYIVQLKEGLPEVTLDKADTRLRNMREFGNVPPRVMSRLQQLEKRHKFKAQQGFGTVVKGFSATLTAAQLSQLRADPDVRLIEPDVRAKAVAQTLPYGIQNVGATASPTSLAGDGLDNAKLNGVRVFVVDTGVSTGPDLNVVEQVNYVGDGFDQDCNGHGTHVAGTIGARDNDQAVVGVAPGVAISSLKVLDCAGSGYSSSIIKAFDYAASQALAQPGIKFVANASIGLPTGAVVSALDTAILNAVGAGVLVSVAAGNSADNTCSTSMTRLSSSVDATGVMAVGAVDSAGREASFSSFGSCVATWAPGVSVLSTYKDGTVVSMSGTSMAAPHVAGAAAVLRAFNPALTPAQADKELKGRALKLTTLSKDGRPIQHVNISTVGADTQVNQSVASVATSVIDFGTVKLKARKVQQKVSIKNTGTAVMALTGLKGLPTSVKVVGSTCSKVAVGSSCAFTLELSTSTRVTFSNTVTTVGAGQNGSFVVKGAVI